MLEIQRYLITPGKNLKTLNEEFGIFSKEYDDRIILNYDQIKSYSFRFSQIVRECRSLILRKNTFNVLSRSLDRFYNYGEDLKSNKFPFDKEDTYYYEKLDGSIINVYHDEEKWCVSTRGQAFSENINKFNHIWLEIIEKAFSGEINYIFENVKANKQFTYIFEFTSPENRVIIPYKDYNVSLLAIRNKYNGRYSKENDVVKFSKEINCKLPKKYNFKNINEINNNINLMEIMEEGYVCYNEYLQWRIKVKNPKYLALTHMKDKSGELSLKRIIYLVFEKEYDEYLSYFPEDKIFFDPYILGYENMIKEINKLMNDVKDISNKKELALKLKNNILSSIIFSLYDGKELNDIFNKMTDDKRNNLLEYFKHI